MEKKKKVIAITGGIGSGKSYVAQLLTKRGITVYDCDAAAKRLMQQDAALQEGLKKLIGADVYQGNQLQKSVVTKFLLASEEHQQAIQQLVHPAVATDFLHSPNNWIESAILFEAHFDQLIHPDIIISIIAPLQTRVQRVMQRNQLTEAQAMDWIDKQWPQEELVKRSTFTINNDDDTNLDQQIDCIFKQIDFHI